MMNIKRRTIVATVLILLFSVKGMADKKNDMVKISMPNKTAIEIVGVDINKNAIDTAFIAQNIERFFKFSKTSNIAEMMVKAPRLFQIEEKKEGLFSDANVFYELNINEREIPNQILSAEDFTKNLYYLQRHQLEFSNDLYTYKILFDELEQLASYKTEAFEKVIVGVMNDNYKEKSRCIQKQYYSVDENFVVEKIYENEKHPSDMIELLLGTGLQNVKNTWVASVHTAIAFSFKNKGVVRNSYGINYEWQYDFSDVDEKNINHFVDLQYSHDFSKDPEKSDLYTVWFGSLVKKQGDLYEDNTFRLGVIKEIGENFSVGPQFYFNDFFKNVIPSVTIGFGF